MNSWVEGTSWELGLDFWTPGARNSNTCDSHTLGDVHSSFIHSWSTSMWLQACDSDILRDVRSVLFSYENENFDPGL